MSDIWTTHTLTSGDLSLDLLPGIGGRLWDVCFQGQSLLFQNTDLTGIAVNLDTLSQLPTRSPHFGFPLWGGEKSWVAPDTSWIDGGPFKALDSGKYEITRSEPTTIHMQSTICPDTALQIERIVTLKSGALFSIKHTLTNRGDSDRYAGIWSVLMLKRPAQIGVISGTKDPLQPIFGDARDLARKHGVHAVFDCRKSCEFKLGLSNPTGKTFIRFPDSSGPLWLCCQTPVPDAEDNFAHGHSFEVFNSGGYPYCEAEWHSPARTLKPDERLTFKQEFHLRTESDLMADLGTTLDEVELFSCMS